MFHEREVIRLLCSLQGVFWYFNVALRGTAFIVLVRRRMERTFPALVAMLGVSTIKSMYLIGVWTTRGRDAYASVWNIPQIIDLTLYAVATIEAYRLQSKGARLLTRRIGDVVAVLLAAISATIVAATADLIPSPWAGEWPILLIARHFELGCLILLVLSIWLYRSLLIPMRPNVRSHVRIASAFFGGLVLGQTFGSFDGIWAVAGESLMFVICSVCYLFWIWKITPAGERVLPTGDISSLDLENRVRQLRDYRDLAKDLLQNEQL